MFAFALWIEFAIHIFAGEFESEAAHARAMKQTQLTFEPLGVALDRFVAADDGENSTALISGRRKLL